MKCYRKIVQIIKKNFPEYKVSVRRTKLPDTLCGDCRLVNGKKKRKEFLIRINNRLSEDLAIETFVHEWAHVIAWHAPGDDHGCHWGRAYSKVYRIYLNEYVEVCNSDC
mgnify:CR=1 FL=1